jgi:hypothetical protein
MSCFAAPCSSSSKPRVPPGRRGNANNYKWTPNHLQLQNLHQEPLKLYLQLHISQFKPCVFTCRHSRHELVCSAVQQLQQAPRALG